MLTPASQIALVGFGPCAAHIARVLAPRGQALRAFDEPAAHERIEAAGVDVAADLATALRGVRLVIVEHPALPHPLQPGQVLIDLASTTVAEHQALTTRGSAAGVHCLAGQLQLDRNGMPLLHLVGERAAAVAAALTALGLPTHPASVRDIFSAGRTAAPAAPAPQALRRAELP